MKDQLKNEAITLLRQLIATPSLSREESHTAALLGEYLEEKGLEVRRRHHNLWVLSSHWKKDAPALLLNSHHDTVKPVTGWTRNPFEATQEGNKLYGLGSNDAGASLVSLIAVFLSLFDREDLPFNLVLAATAEEEISGSDGIASILEMLPPIAFGIVGEPTQMDMAIAEKGLLVIDAVAEGRSGHAAREEGDNAIYRAVRDIEWIRSYRFPRRSKLLGEVKCTVTQIEAGTQHNVVPDRCRFVIDLRTNEHYSNEEAFRILQENTESKLEARSFRLNSSGIDPNHPLVESGRAIGLKTFGSATLSDQALLPFPTVKMGCGDSARSHTADEYIRLSEIGSGIDVYLELLEQLASRLEKSFSKHQL